VNLFDILGGPALTLGYYLFKLFGIEAALLIAWGQWQRHTSFRARRLTITFGSLTILQLFLLMVYVATGSGTSWGPPLERAVGVASLGFLIWGFTPFFRKLGSLGNLLLASHTTFAFTAYIVTGLLWSGSDDFNQSYWEIGFILWQVALAIFGIANCALEFDDERYLVIVTFATMLTGYIGHFFMAGYYTQPNIPVLVRLSEMIAYPILAVSIYQAAMQSLAARTREYQILSQESGDQLSTLIKLFEATKQITASLNLDKILSGATESIAIALNADQCAIALPDDETDLSRLRLISIYNPSRKGRGEAVTFPTRDQPAIKHVINNKESIQVDEYRDDTKLELLFALMGASDAGPLLVQPLLRKEEVIGLLILGSSISKRIFTDTEVELSHSLAEQITVAIGHAKDYNAVSSKSQQLSWTLRNQELEAGKRRAAMEAELKKSREEVGLFSQRLYDYEVAQKEKEIELQQTKEQIAQLEEIVEQTKADREQARQQGEELATLNEKIDDYNQQLATFQAEKVTLHQKIEQLSQEATDAERLQESLKKANQRIRKLAQVLKQVRSQPLLWLNNNDSTELDTLSWGVIVGDTNDKVSRANIAATRFITQEKRPITGLALSDISNDERWQQAVEQLKTKPTTPISTELKVGEQILRATISPMLSASNGTMEGSITFLYDITAEIDAQQAKDEFVASISQDLRTPMTSIMGYTDLLLSEAVGAVNSMQRKFLQRIKANADRMGTMLSDLIGVTTIDAGQLELNPTTFDLVELIEDVMIITRTAIEEKELELEQDFPQNLPLVEADPDTVQQILRNLLNNAIKVTPEKRLITLSGSIYEEIEDEVTLTFVLVSVKDKGGGIAEQDKPRVFDRFYRATEPLIQGLGETGVGLAVVKALVEANGGKTWVESEIGDGTTFFFTLPMSNQSDDPWSSFLGTLPPLDLNSGTN